MSISAALLAFITSGTAT